MGRFVRSLFKIFCFTFSAVLGVTVGLAVFSSLMLVTVGGSSMLPELEQGDRVLVLQESRVTGPLNLSVGDLVVYEAPYYTTDGEGLLKIRRITGTRGSWLRLDSDLKTVGESEVLVRRSEIVGKVIGR